MNKRFQELVAGLEVQAHALLAMEPVIAEYMPTDTPIGGIYLFSEGSQHLYAGRTKRRICLRVRSHFGTARDCPFAWLLAREATGQQATYKPEGSRKALLADSEFRREYEKAKERIRTMHVRYVHQPDPWRQVLLEVCVAYVSEAKYNDFDTH